MRFEECTNYITDWLKYSNESKTDGSLWAFQEE